MIYRLNSLEIKKILKMTDLENLISIVRLLINVDLKSLYSAFNVN